LNSRPVAGIEIASSHDGLSLERAREISDADYDGYGSDRNRRRSKKGSGSRRVIRSVMISQVDALA